MLLLWWRRGKEDVVGSGFGYLVKVDVNPDRISGLSGGVFSRDVVEKSSTGAHCKKVDVRRYNSYSPLL